MSAKFGAPIEPPAIRASILDRLARIAPGLPTLIQYKFVDNFRHDLLAGLSVAAVAVPVAIAYAQLANFNPAIGLYSSILPLVAYAIFGTSRQLMVNPDAASCAIIAAAIAPMAIGNADLYWSLSVALAFIAGLMCIAASFLRLGALADFLSKPILIGFLNGIAISIFLGQIGKVCGFSIESEGIGPRFLEFVAKLPQTHVPTLALGAVCMILLFLSIRVLPSLPAALVAMVVSTAAVALLKLDTFGIAILGPVPAGLPPLRWPTVPLEDIASLVADAAGLALVLFSSGMLTARSFASKGGYQINADSELAALGAANIASAFSQGFAVTGADSRTAVGNAAGGRTQVTGLIAAAAIAIVLLFLTSPMQYIPIAALGAILIVSSFSLFDVNALREIWKIDRREFLLSAVTTLGVVAVGPIKAVLVAVALALIRFVKQVARPRDEILGEVSGAGFHSIERHPHAKTFPGLVLYRFNSPITFFNSDYFKQRVLAAAEASGPGLRWFVIDAIPISQIDMNGLYALRDLRNTLEARGIFLILAGRRTEFLNWLQEIDFRRPEHEDLIFSTLRDALNAFLNEAQPRPMPSKEYPDGMMERR